MLPLGGLLIAVFVGWRMKPSDVVAEAAMGNVLLYNIWRFSLKFIAPVGIAFVLYNGLK